MNGSVHHRTIFCLPTFFISSTCKSYKLLENVAENVNLVTFLIGDPVDCRINCHSILRTLSSLTIQKTSGDCISCVFRGKCINNTFPDGG